MKPWTSKDHRDLKAHSKTKTPVAKISKAMRRTLGAIRQKALVSLASRSDIAADKTLGRMDA